MNNHFIPQYKKRDENGAFILNDKYFMVYSHTDGFTERLDYIG
ncbi:hypothetical protein SAMN05421856_103410 [Chryseobacterium taichungense]|uniref:Uncharacterized protein n=1 Tax=Chryseobacterium taichungense TaxID=295069 RepID=A0A1H7YMF0_9FLAO|nr:hypothetical protein SAMN05421856_103410 [Chryseobacterium taichungense]